MTEAPKPPKYIGEPIKRREDPRLLQGLGRYVDDLAPPGCLHVGIVRSTHAHARLKSVDAAAAAAAKVAEGVEPLEDLFASGEFRAHLARVHCRRAIRAAAG